MKYIEFSNLLGDQGAVSTQVLLIIGYCWQLIRQWDMGQVKKLRLSLLPGFAINR